MSAIWAYIRRESAVWAVTAPGVIVSLITAFAHLDKTQAGWLSCLVLGAGTVVVALAAKPPHVAVLAGAAGNVIQGLLLFNVHASSAERAAIIALVTLFTGHVALRPNLTPRSRA